MTGAPRTTGGNTDKVVEILTAPECLALLAATSLGRVAFIESVGVLPVILPVDYQMIDDSVVFRTDLGSKLSAAVRGEPVAFEIDGLEKVRGVGWSVLVRGRAEELTDPSELAAAEDSGLVPWGPGAKAHYIRVRASKIEGRRITRRHSWSDWWD